MSKPRPPQDRTPAPPPSDPEPHPGPDPGPVPGPHPGPVPGPPPGPDPGPDPGPRPDRPRRLRLRLYLLQSGTGAPVPSRAVALMGRTREGHRRALAVLVTDGRGYASVAVPTARLADMTDLQVGPLGRDDLAVPVDLAATAGAAIIPVNLEEVDTLPYAPGTPSIQTPDQLDWELSPGSFSTESDLAIGAG